MSPERLDLRLHAIAFETAAVRLLDLRDADGRALPAFQPGAHVDVRLNGHLTRSYSLVGDPADAGRYLLGVQRDPQSRGGSQHLCEAARVGDLIEVSHPINRFPLIEDAAASVFIAGGIGITPILSMIRSFGELPPAPWKLYYLTRSPETTAFLEELKDPALRRNVVVHHDQGDPANAYDLWPALEKPNSGHVFCCG
ncbi:MAG TPA: ferredoxin reductase, partial [Hyphomicrobiaceae bacterium]